MGSDIGAVLAGIINNSKGLPSIDLSQLMTAIQANQQGNNTLINQMPAQVQQLLKQYGASTTGAGQTYTGATNAIGNNLLSSTNALYGPNNPAVQATLAALKQQDYSTQPGTMNALKANLAATGGLERGGAANAITKATLAPAAQYSGQAATVMGQQLQAQQQNVQQALNKIAQMDDATAQSVFGMSVQQATQILQSGNQATQTQLADLINSNNQGTNQMLNVEGLQANNQYQNQVTQNAKDAALVNSVMGMMGGAIGGGAMGGFGGGGSTGLPAGADVTSPSYQQNSGAIASQIGLMQ